MDMTQKELAKHLQVADSTLSYWEMGKYEPDNDTLMRLSRFFQVSIDYILGGDFTKWDISGSKMLYQAVDMTQIIDSGLSVAEHRVAYSDVSQPDIWSNATYDSQNTQAAFARVEFEGLTQEEVDLIAEYALFIKSRRRDK